MKRKSVVLYAGLRVRAVLHTVFRRRAVQIVMDQGRGSVHDTRWLLNWLLNSTMGCDTKCSSEPCSEAPCEHGEFTVPSCAASRQDGRRQGSQSSASRRRHTPKGAWVAVVKMARFWTRRTRLLHRHIDHLDDKSPKSLTEAKIDWAKACSAGNTTKPFADLWAVSGYYSFRTWTTTTCSSDTVGKRQNVEPSRYSTPPPAACL